MHKMNEDSNFENAFKTVLKIEGGYVNDPDDRGGETKYGISKRSYPTLDIKNLTEENAKNIYYEDFWIINKCNAINNFWLAEKLFSLSINLGCHKAGQILQRALRSVGKNLKEDGIIGPKTLEATLSADPSMLLASLKSEAAGYYRIIVNSNPSQNKFLIGWLNRAYA